MATVVFKPKFIDVAGSRGEQYRPLCTRACGSSSCLKLRKQNKCSATTTNDGKIACTTFRYIGKDGFATAREGTEMEIAL